MEDRSELEIKFHADIAPLPELSIQDADLLCILLEMLFDNMEASNL